MPFVRSMPEQASFLDMIKGYRDVLGHLIPFEEALMRGPSSLSPAQRELIAAFTSGLNRCNYCYTSHTYTVGHFGVEQATVEALVDDVMSAPVDPKMKPLLNYVRKLTLAQHTLVDADADAVYDVGWDDNALMTAIMVCAHFNLCNRLSNGVGLDIPDEQMRAIARVLAEDGYEQAFTNAGVTAPPR